MLYSYLTVLSRSVWYLHYCGITHVDARHMKDTRILDLSGDPPYSAYLPACSIHQVPLDQIGKKVISVSHVYAGYCSERDG